MNGVTMLVLLVAGGCAGFWLASVFHAEDERALREYLRRRRDRWE